MRLNHAETTLLEQMACLRIPFLEPNTGTCNINIYVNINNIITTS